MKERIIVGADGRKYITTEPQINKREWQGLTDKEIEDCLEMSIHGTCRAVEAKLKEKNT
jgi:hypothetical protein